MIVRHRMVAHGTCPENGAVDRYDVEVTARRKILVEDIQSKTAELLAAPIHQEEFTELLAKALDAGVTTVCRHGEVETTCEIPVWR